MKSLHQLSVFALLLAASVAEAAQSKTYLCRNEEAPAETLIFRISQQGIRFIEWKPAFRGCQMDTRKTFHYERQDGNSAEIPASTLSGATYLTSYDWYYTAHYFLTFEDSIGKHKENSIIRLEVNGSDADGCFIDHAQFRCEVR